jgi:hypothetical protein
LVEWSNSSEWIESFAELTIQPINYLTMPSNL